MSPAAPLRVVVVGAGITGLATARELTRRGAAVTVLDTAARGTGATDRSLAWLNAFGETLAEYHRFRVEAIAAHAALPSAEGGRFVHLDGALWWPGPAGVAAWADARARLTGWGYPIEELSAADVAARFPQIDAAAVEVGFAVLAPAEGWADLPGLVASFAAQVVAGGGRVVADSGPVRLRLTGEAVTGIDAGDESFAADAVVVASGSATPVLLARDTGFVVPVQTATGLLVRTAPFDGAPAVVVNSPRVNLRPGPGGGIAFDTDWAQSTVTAGPGGTWGVDDAAVATAVEGARALLTGGRDLTVTGCSAGAKPVPADGLPVLGSVPGAPDCHVAFLHSGATNALHVARVVTDEVLGEAQVPGFLRAARFTRPAVGSQSGT